jgi:hypothetical protein
MCPEKRCDAREEIKLILKGDRIFSKLFKEIQGPFFPSFFTKPKLILINSYFITPPFPLLYKKKRKTLALASPMGMVWVT